MENWARHTQSPTQSLVGFAMAFSEIVGEYGFELEPAAHPNNPFHAHILIPELNLPYATDSIESVFKPGVRRRLDDLSERFTFLKLEEINNANRDSYPKPYCKECLSFRG